MPLMELSLDTTDEAVDWVFTLLAGINYISDIRIAKYTETDLDEIANADNTQSDWAFTLWLYIPYDTYVNARRAEVINLLSSLQRMGISTPVHMTIVEQKTVNAEVLSPLIRRIGQRFIVLSPDAPYTCEEADEVPLRLKASAAFGSGLHPATVVCLQLLERHIIPAMDVLDLGSGSGILSVAMAKLGANVLALDSDRIAVESTQDAIHRNEVELQVKVMEGSLGQGSGLGHWMGGNAYENVPTLEPAASFDLIAANILARVHTALAADYRRALRTDAQAGLLITSGFTSEYEDAVATSLQDEGFEIVDCERLNEWVALAFRLKG
jgi:ribosomal protein L11 methyltransferase